MVRGMIFPKRRIAVKKVIGVLVFLSSVLFSTFALATTADNIVYQANYALSTRADGTSSQMISGNYVGDWNWLYNDSSSYLAVKGWYGCNSSDWAVSGDGCSSLAGWVSFYSNPSTYGYINSASPFVNRYGRGGQCAYFISLVLYRAGVYTGGLNINTMWNNQDIPLSNAQPGYVLQRYNSQTPATNHVAIIVGVTRDGSGTVTAVTVVDSNWVSDNGANMEIIAKHTISNPDPNVWRVWHSGY